jgi:protocatechuate 3,4-dioxygenase beta subunit
MSAMGTAPVFPRRASIDAQGRFELRALPAGYPHALEVRPEALADAKVKSLEFEAGRVRELEVELLRGAALRGTVRDETGTPVAGADVVAAESAIWGFPGEELAETKSDAQGAFALEHVAPGKCLLLAKKEGTLESEHQKLELRNEEQRDRLELVLGRGAVITGTVRQPDGSAAGDASVQVNFDPEAMVGMGAFNAARGGSSKAKSGADGRFEATGLGKGPFVVSATLERAAADGGKEKWMAKAEHVKPDTRDLELTLAAPSVITGRVHDAAGAPVTKFHVSATMDSAAFFLPSETRVQDCDDPEGDFVLRDLEAGKWKVAASADGFGPMQPVEVALPRADETPLELVLAPAASIAGRVLDPGGKPASGARVTLHVPPAQRMQRMRGDVKAPEATSGEDGTFVLGGLGGGTVSIFAERAGFAASEPASVETLPGQKSEGVVLKLRKGAVVTGEVFDSAGKPAGGVRVVAQEAGNFNTNMKSADGEGRFRFESLAPGSWTISALMEANDLDLEGNQSEVTASFMDNLRFTMVQLEDGEEEHVVLGAPPKNPVRVRGRVLHGREPVEGGLVTFFAEGAKGLEALKIASIGADGGYQTELNAPGRYVVSVQINATGAAFQQDNVEYRETIPEVVEHVLDLTLPLGAIRGVVRGSDRRPLAGSRVTLVTEGGIESGSLLGGHYAEATTDEDGHYAFQYLRPGGYAVAAGGALFGGAFGGQTQAGRLVRTGLDVGEGKTLEGIDFQLEDPGTIHGRVVDATGQPVKDAAIFVRDESGHLLDRLSMIQSAGDGTFKYEGVSAGEYLVSARGKNLASVESAPVRVPKAGSASVELVLAPGTKLVIEVIDDDGKPLQARISVTDSRGRAMQGMLGFAEMASGFSDGFDSSKQTVGPLPPGSYTVTAEASEGKKTSKPVTLDGQPERKLKLRLR